MLAIALTLATNTPFTPPAQPTAPVTTIAAKKPLNYAQWGHHKVHRTPHCIPKVVDVIIAEGIDLPRLPRCTRITCPKGSTNLMRPSGLGQWLALSGPRDRADDAPKTAPKGDPKAPIKLGIG